MAILGCCGCPYHSSMIYTIGEFASWHLFGANIDPLIRIYQIFKKSLIEPIYMI